MNLLGHLEARSKRLEADREELIEIKDQLSKLESLLIRQGVIIANKTYNMYCTYGTATDTGDLALCNNLAILVFSEGDIYKIWSPLCITHALEQIAEINT